MERADVIVLGLGGMGSAAAYHLASRGHRVLGFDAFPRGHAQGSSHGSSRIIRQSIYEAPEYVPLVLRAYEFWRELGERAGRRLLTVTGRLLLGPEGSRTVTGMLRSARVHDLPHEVMSATEVRRRFPGFQPTDDLVGVYEPEAGMLDPEGCVAAHLDQAAAHGAVLRHAEPVLSWHADRDGARVETRAGVYAADQLVVTAGPWIGEVLADLRLPLRVVRQVNAHFEPREPERFTLGRCPVYSLEVPEGHYYGVPAIPGYGFKIGRHDAGEPCTPASIRREVGDEEVAGLRAVLDRYLPGSAGALQLTLTCMYTRTPDGHFIVDHHPEHPPVVFASACSGHGFKYACVIGETLADLATTGRTAQPIAPFRLDRFESVRG